MNGTCAANAAVVVAGCDEGPPVYTIGDMCSPLVLILLCMMCCTLMSWHTFIHVSWSSSCLYANNSIWVFRTSVCGFLLCGLVIHLVILIAAYACALWLTLATAVVHGHVCALLAPLATRIRAVGMQAFSSPPSCSWGSSGSNPWVAIGTSGSHCATLLAPRDIDERK